MTDLTTALAIAGGLVIAGLAAQSVWQARKAAPRKAAATAERTEPVADLGLATGDSVGAVVGPGQDGGTAATATSLAGTTLALRRTPLRLDALIDAIAPLSLESPVSGEMVLAHLPPTRRAGSKPFLIEGLNTQNGEWEPATPGQHYGELQAGVQMANRHGALNEIEYSEFVQKVQAFAEAVGAMPDFPDMLDVVARARELDAFAADHDAQLAVHLRAKGAAWSLGFLQQQAAQHGFVPGAIPGRMVLASAEEGAPPLLTLTFDAQAALAEDPGTAPLREATLAFDVPQTGRALEPFGAWRDRALALATSLDAVIVDDHGAPLTLPGFDAIGGELGRLYDALDARDLAAGSAAARRLFS